MKTREEWLVRAVTELLKLPELSALADPKLTFRVSCGWPSRQIRKRLGECWHRKCSGDNTCEIFITPRLEAVNTPQGLLPTLLHELIHALVGVECGHKGEFARVARNVGLSGKLTSTEVDEESDLHAYLEKVAKKLGPYPHAALDVSAASNRPKKQSTRMKKLQCPECGCIVRTTQSWIDAYADTGWNCPCGGNLLPGEG